MFFASLVLAGIQLVGAAIVFAIARREPAGGLALGVLGVLFAMFLVPSVLMFFSIAAFYQAIVLTLIGIACLAVKARQGVFLGGAIVATGLVFGWCGSSGLMSWSGLKERYPFESVSSRLAYETNAAKRGDSTASATTLLATSVLPAATLERLDEAEHHWSWSWSRRSDSLRLVHSSYVEQFIESPGFGVSRMPRPSPASIAEGQKRERMLYPLDPRPDVDGSPAPGAGTGVSNEGPALATSIFAGAVGKLHQEARRDFLSPEGFGYVRDRDHVAGFVPHAFSDYPRPFGPGELPGRWLTVRVELVSLLKHDRPMVYVSEHLPNMTELRRMPVREIDDFERGALELLAGGDDLAIDDQLSRIRAVGSLRAMRQCLECHEVERGTLLGAFSYEFLCDPPLREPKKKLTAEREKLL